MKNSASTGICLFRMTSIKRILVVTPNYPIEGDPVYPFVKNLCDEFAKQGLDVTILAPQSLTSALLHRKKTRPLKREYDVLGRKVTVYHPYSFTPFHGALKLYNYMIKQCVLSFLRKKKLMPDVCYCHFWCSAYWALPYMKKRGIPVIVASGESEIGSLLSIDKRYPDFNEYVRGVVCVSSKNRDESVTLGYTKPEKCIVLPNAVNTEMFQKKDKNACREKIGLPHDSFIVAFVGWFIDRKGPLRVAAALNKVKGAKSIFIGKGSQDPHCDGILFKGALPHEQVPEYLGAADCFVLPTLHEGCCNAVVEAMACGLPIVSSNLPFNWDVLDETNSIMVDPQNIDEIADAIRQLFNNHDMRKILSDGALRKAANLTISQRAARIIEFIEGITI